MKKYILIILPLLVITLAGCEQKQEMVKEVYINHDIELCGVNDPAENHKGLKEEIDQYLDFIEEYNQEFVDVTIGIFEDSIGNQTWIKHDRFLHHPEYLYPGVLVYRCDSLLFGGRWNGNPFPYNSSYVVVYPKKKTDGGFYEVPLLCDECDEFFKNNKLVGIIAHITNLPKDKVTNN